MNSYQQMKWSCWDRELNTWKKSLFPLTRIFWTIPTCSDPWTLPWTHLLVYMEIRRKGSKVHVFNELIDWSIRQKQSELFCEMLETISGRLVTQVPGHTRTRVPVNVTGFKVCWQKHTPKVRESSVRYSFICDRRFGSVWTVWLLGLVRTVKLS